MTREEALTILDARASHDLSEIVTVTEGMDKQMTRDEVLKTLEERGAHAIYVAVNGSESHGTALAGSSDLDVIGVAVPPLQYYFGLREYGSKGTKEIREGELDAVMFEARKAVRLLAGQNPNVIMSLWVRPEDVLYCTEAGRLLLEHRDLFVTKKVATTFLGYATSAIKKMGAPDGPTGDMGAKRKAFVEQYGYDLKDASHVIRLLRVCEEILLTGQVHVWRGDRDAEELMAIKRGEWSLERVKAEADGGFERVKAAEQASHLPDDVDHDAVNRLCVSLVTATMRERGSFVP